MAQHMVSFINVLYALIFCIGSTVPNRSNLFVKFVFFLPILSA